MKPDTVTLYNLFQNQKRFVVPLFQRPYVWNQKQQWAPLWEDIRGRAEAQLSSASGSTNGAVHPHFLGAIVTNQTRTPFKRLPVFEVIDGQQRLTTLQLFIAALRDYASATDIPQLHAEMIRLSENNYSHMPDESERFKVWPTNADREEFSAVMKANNPEAVRALAAQVESQWRTPRLSGAYLFFHQKIKEWIEGSQGEHDEAERLRRVDALFITVQELLQLVIIELDEKDNPQVIFETLNFRGVPLLPSDLVRNFIFHHAQRNNEEVDELYARYWQEYDGFPGQPPFWKQTAQQGRLTRERIDLFLFHFLTYKLATDINVNNLFDAFKEWWNRRKNPSAEAGLDELKQNSSLYRQLLEPDPSTRLGLFAERLQRMELSTVYPLLLYMVVEAKVEGRELEGMIEDLESYLVRRFVAGLETTNYNRFFVGLIQALRKEPTVTRQALRNYLLQSNSPSVRWPGDREVETAWLSFPAYKRMKSRGTEMILRALDRHLTTKYQEKLELKGKLTVEHVLPQKWKQHWPAPELSGTPDETPEAWRNRLLHTLGNLTLLTEPLNSKNTNSAYEVKRELIIKQSALRLNTYFQDQPEWNEAAIIERGRALLATALEIWRFPENAAQAEVALAGSTEEALDLEGLEPEDLLVEIENALQPLLPSRYYIHSANDGPFFQVQHSSWRGSAHFEVTVKPNAIFVDFHNEVGKQPARDNITAAMRELIPAITAAFPEQEVVFDDSRNQWRWLTVRFTPDEAPGRVARAMLRLIETMAPHLDLVDGIGP